MEQSESTGGGGGGGGTLLAARTLLALAASVSGGGTAAGEHYGRLNEQLVHCLVACYNGGNWLRQAAGDNASAPGRYGLREQRSKFNTDQLFTALAALNDVQYAGAAHAPQAERCEQFARDCRHGHIPIAFTSSGLNLELRASPATAAAAADGSGRRPASVDYVSLDERANEVNFSARCILNGVAVRCVGTLHTVHLCGRARLTFDADTAGRLDTAHF